MAAIKMKNPTPTTATSPARAALAQAIANHAAATKALDDAQTAAMKARTGFFAADHRLELLRQDAEAPPPDSVIDDLAAGADLATITKPAADLRAAIEAAEQEVASWRAIRNQAEEAIEARRKALDWASTMLDNKARAVVEAEFNPDAAMEEMRALQRQYLDKAVALWAASQGLDFHCDARRAIESFLAKDWQGEASHGIKNNPAGAAWREAFAQLKSDANAPLPEA